MATLSIAKNYADATILFESDLDDIRDALLTFLNTTKLNDDNIQDSGITASSKLVNSSISGAKLNANVVDDSTIELVSSQIRIKDDGITTAKIADSAVTSAKIADSAVTTAKIADGGVTRAKLEDRTVTTDGTDPGAGGISKSTSSGTFSTSSSTLTDVTNVSTTITTTGRPVMVFLEPDGTTNPAELKSSRSASTNSAQYAILRDATTVGQAEITVDGVSSSGSSSLSHSPSGFMVIDDVAAGTYTYKLQAKVATTGSMPSVEVNYVRIVAVEL